MLTGVEAAGFGVDTDKHAATLTLGTPGVLHGSMSYLIQDADGQIIDPHSISAGLDYPGTHRASVMQCAYCCTVVLLNLYAHSVLCAYKLYCNTVATCWLRRIPADRFSRMPRFDRAPVIQSAFGCNLLAQDRSDEDRILIIYRAYLLRLRC